MSTPVEAPPGSVSCGDLRREPDGRWFFDQTYLGRDGQPRVIAVCSVGDRLGVVAARLAEALGQACDAMVESGEESVVLARQRGRETLRRFERWRAGLPWDGPA